MKNILILLSTIGILLFAAPVQAIEFPSLDNDIYVQDSSDVLSDRDEEELRRLGIGLEEATTAQIAVMAIPSLEGEPIAQYALEALRHYGLGTKEDNNGVLLVVSTGDREIYIATGYGLEGALPDGKVGRILDEYAVPYLQQDQYSEGIMNTYIALYQEVATEYGWDGEAAAPQTKAAELPSYEPRKEWPPHRVIIAIIIVIWIIISLFGDGVGRGSSKKGGKASSSRRSRRGSSKRSSGRGGSSRRGRGGSGGGGGAGRKF